MTEAGYAPGSARVSSRSFKDDSEIACINRGVLRLVDTHPLVRRVLKRCDVLRDETSGYFDMRTPAFHRAYARGDHVWNPHSARSPAGILSATVVGAELATADAYATAAFAIGPLLAPHWTARLNGYEAMTILADETVFKTGGFPDE